jgi:hypothetical protein
MTFSNGSQYSGEWVNEKRQGKGVFTYSNGDSYLGEFKENMEQGSGIYTYANGQKEKRVYNNGVVTNRAKLN